MTMFGNLHSYASSEASRNAAAAKSQAISAEEKAAALREQVDKLTLVCAALWELVKDKTALTEEDLMTRVGVLAASGKLAHTLHPCAQCGRPVAPRHRTCMYCGATQPTTGVFDAL
jgi:hypothetical protein